MDGKRDWMRGLTLALCVVLLLLSFGQWRRISDLEQDIWNAQNSIMDNVSHLEDQVASLLHTSRSRVQRLRAKTFNELQKKMR